MRVVLDSNVVIFTLLFGGKAAVVVGGMSLERVTLVMTEAILIEIAWVLRIRLGLSPDRILSTQDEIRRRAEMVTPRIEAGECIAPDDNRILEAALASGRTIL